MRCLTPFLLVVIIAVSACGESPEEKAARERAEFVADSTRKADSVETLIRPRRELYGIAIDMVKQRLKAPSSARIPAVSLVDSDSLSFDFSSDSALVEVKGAYEAQNMFGVYLPGRFLVKLRRDSSGYVPQFGGIDGLDIQMN